MNTLFISNNLSKAEKDIFQMYENITLFEANELKLEDVKHIKDEVYKTSDRVRYILIKADKFHYVSQNAMLKLLEEPPKNTVFLLLTKSKYSLFDTIKSRLILKELKYEKRVKELNLNINNLTNGEILEFIQNNKKIEKEEFKDLVYLIFQNLNKSDEFVLKTFEKVIKLIELNSNKEVCLSLLFLAIRRGNATL